MPPNYHKQNFSAIVYINFEFNIQDLLTTTAPEVSIICRIAVLI